MRNSNDEPIEDPREMTQDDLDALLVGRPRQQWVQREYPQDLESAEPYYRVMEKNKVEFPHNCIFTNMAFYPSSLKDPGEMQYLVNLHNAGPEIIALARDGLIYREMRKASKLGDE